MASLPRVAATMRSTYPGSSAENCIDDDIVKKLCHTDCSKQNQGGVWLQIDIGALAVIGDISVFNRNTGTLDNMRRLGEYSLYVGTTPLEAPQSALPLMEDTENNILCGSFHIPADDNDLAGPFTHSCDSALGRYATIVLTGDNRCLNLREVMLYASEGSPSPPSSLPSSPPPAPPLIASPPTPPEPASLQQTESLDDSQMMMMGMPSPIFVTLLFLVLAVGLGVPFVGCFCMKRQSSRRGREESTSTEPASELTVEPHAPDDGIPTSTISKAAARAAPSQRDSGVVLNILDDGGVAPPPPHGPPPPPYGPPPAPPHGPPPVTPLLPPVPLPPAPPSQSVLDEVAVRDDLRARLKEAEAKAAAAEAKALEAREAESRAKAEATRQVEHESMAEALAEALVEARAEAEAARAEARAAVDARADAVNGASRVVKFAADLATALEKSRAAAEAAAAATAMESTAEVEEAQL